MRLPHALRHSLADAGLLLCLSAAVAFAGESAANLTAAGIPSNCADFASKVSASEGNFGTTNQFGCLGAFQFCPGTFEQYYSGSAQSFLNNPSAQTAAWTQYEQNEWSRIPVSYDDATGTVTIGDRIGSFTGMSDGVNM